MRLIDADALHKAYMELRNFKQDPQSGDWISLRAVPLTAVIRMLNEAPTIEPKRGEWIDMGDFEQCSVCKSTHLKEFQSYYGKTTWVKTPYCPNCGAKMKGADDEDN